MFIVNPPAEQVPNDLVARMATTTPGTIGHFRDDGFMDPGIIARMPGTKIVGTALTVRLTVPDSCIAHYALTQARPGDVLVFERGSDQFVAAWGGTASAAAAKLGVAGVIIDGAGHDIALAAKLGLPIWCRRITPVTTKHRALGGALNVPISCGGVIVWPGDVVIADDNGVAVIPRSQIAAVVEAAEKFDAMKAGMVQSINSDPAFSFPVANGAKRMVDEALERQ